MNFIKLFYLEDLYSDRIKLHNLLDPVFNIIDIFDKDTILDIYDKDHLNIFLTDIRVFDFNDYEIIEYIKTISNDNIVIVLTGSGSEEAASKSMLKGADLYLIKNDETYSNFQSILQDFIDAKSNSFLTRNKFFSKILDPQKNYIRTVNKVDGTISYISDNVTEILGCKPADLIGKNGLELIHPDDLKILNKELLTSDLKGITNKTIELRIENSKSDYKNFRLILIPFFNKENILVEYNCLLQQSEKNNIEASNQISENSIQGIFDLNVITGEMKINSEYAEIFGVNSDNFNVTLENLCEKLHPDDKEEALKSLSDYIQGVNPYYKSKFRILNKDKEYTWILATGKIISRDDQNKPLRILGVSTILNPDDIKRTDEYDITTFFHLDAEAFAVADAESLIFTDSNEACLNLYGYTKEEFLKLTLIDISGEPEKTKNQLNYYKDTSNIKVPVRYHKNKFGEIFPVSIDIRLINSQDKKLFYISIKDISDRLITYNAIYENEKRFRAVFENSVDAIAVVKNHKHFLVNEAYLDLFAITEKDKVYNRPVIDFYKDEDRSKISSVLNIDVIDSYFPMNFEIDCVREDGSVFAGDITLSAYEQEGDLYFIFIVKDLTKLKQADIAISEGESRFKKIFEETNNIPVQGLDTKYRVIYWNKASEITYGFSQKEALGKKIVDLIVPDDEKDVICKGLEYHFTNEESLPSEEIALLRKDKSKIYVKSTHVLINNSKGEKEIYCLDADVSFKKEAEFKIKQLSRAVDQSPASIMITDIDGKIEYVNKKFEKLTLYTSDEVIGLTPRFLKSGEMDAEEYKKMWNEILAGKEWRGEFHNKKKNNELFWESTLISPVKNDKGIVTHFLAIKEDITEKKLREETILKSEAQFRSLWEGSFDAMRLTDSEGLVYRVNESYCKLVEKKREELENQLFANIYSEDTFEHNVKVYKEHFASKNFKQKVETEMVLWNHKKTWVELSNSYISIENQPLLLLTIFRSIEERKKQENEIIASKEKAEEMSRLKSNFLNNMSHEIRTPMVGILGFSQILYSEIDSPELKEFVEEIIKSGNRMMNTINSILDLSRIEANKLEVKITNTNIIEEIKEVTKALKAIAEQNDLYFIIRSKIDELVIPIDKHLLAQIINNIAGNAIKYTRIGGVIIEVDLGEKDGKDYAVLKVIDSGIGIPKESLSVIFEEFRQVSEGLNRQFEGTGLGLTITKKIVELLNGKIEVKSEVGIGSEFIIYFPLPEGIKKEPAVTEKIKIKEDMDFRDTKVNSELPEVLLVENDSVNRTVMKLFLNKTCKLDLAENGETSVALSKKKRYAAVLMDINLGTGMNGVEAAQEIKKIPGYEKVPIIAVTAYAMVGDKEKFLESGCTHYISKPFDKESLVNLVKSVMVI